MSKIELYIQKMLTFKKFQAAFFSYFGRTGSFLSNSESTSLSLEVMHIDF